MKQSYEPTMTRNKYMLLALRQWETAHDQDVIMGLCAPDWFSRWRNIAQPYVPPRRDEDHVMSTLQIMD